MNIEDYETTPEHRYKTNLANIRQMYQHNVEPTITDEDVHNQFYANLDELDFMLEDAPFREVKMTINEHIRYIKPLDPCRMIHDEYLSILESLKSENQSQAVRESHARRDAHAKRLAGQYKNN